MAFSFAYDKTLLDGKSILVTGATGSFGRAFTEIALQEFRLNRYIVFSRDELKQHEMKQIWPESDDSPVRYLLGDVRDRDRLRRAFEGVDIVVHAAALKQVPALEYDPFEAVMTNILGSKNVIEAALDSGVKRVVAVSTDKSVNPVNLYGATKLVAEKLFVQANSYRGKRDIRFSCVRYGNVLGSRGSVVPLWREQARNSKVIITDRLVPPIVLKRLQEEAKTGKVTITDPRMTRFLVTLPAAVRFVLSAMSMMKGGEIFVPRLPAMSMVELAQVVAPGCEQEVTGIRPGEKLHEVLISVDESSRVVDLGDKYAVLPAQPWWKQDQYAGFPKVPDGWSYTSENDEWRLTAEDVKEMLEEAKA